VDLLNKVRNNVKLSEDVSVIEKILILLYFKGNLSTKEIAKEVLLPLPVVSAIKNEFIKLGFFIQFKGIALTNTGTDFIENNLCFLGIDKQAYNQAILGVTDFEKFLGNSYSDFVNILENRPQVDVTIDQSKSTPDTVLHRAVLCLQNYSLIGKKLLCVGDDDLVSIGIYILLKKLFNGTHSKTVIDVIDIDTRILNYIREVATNHNFNINCYEHNLRETLPQNLKDSHDCFFTDPPYTLPGMELFLSRGIEGLKKQNDLYVYFSFAHKPPDFALNMQKVFTKMGLVLIEILPRFNTYEGASIIGNTSQMHVLKTTSEVSSTIAKQFTDKLYTGEININNRTYQCIECSDKIEVGNKKAFKTIEELKNAGCPKCHATTFNLIKREVKKND